MQTASIHHAAYRSAVLELGPVGYWRLGESHGMTAIDELGVNDMAYENSPALAQDGALIGDTDMAVTFNGTDERAAVQTAVVIDNEPRTIVVWAKTTSTDATFPANAMVDLGDEFSSETRGNEQFTFYIENDTVALRTSNGNRVWDEPSGKDITDGEWHMYALTFPGGNEDDLTAYMDGIEMPINSTNTAGSGDIDTAQHATAIGATVDTESSGIRGYFDGAVDEVAIYDHVLGEQEIQFLYELGTRA